MARRVTHQNLAGIFTGPGKYNDFKFPHYNRLAVQSQETSIPDQYLATPGKLDLGEVEIHKNSTLNGVRKDSLS